MSKPVFVDWIESSGLEYIDTGYVLNSQSCLEFMYLKVISDFTWGILYQAEADGMWFGVNHNSVFWGVYVGRPDEYWGTALNGYLKFDIAKRLVTLKYASSSTIYTKNINLQDNNYPNATLRLGDTYDKKSGGYENRHPLFRIGELRISTNGTIVKDFRPCLYHGEYGLWETIEGRFYGNLSGQGGFIGGND